MIAVGICAGICLGLTLFAFQTKYDFTYCTGILFVLIWCLIVFGILATIWPSEIVSTTYSVLGAAIFSVYLVVDTQLIMGGNKKYSISPEEYVFAALNLYLDIMNLFILILSLVGRGRWYHINEVRVDCIKHCIWCYIIWHTYSCIICLIC